MGKWDRRYTPRRNYNRKKYPDYDYEEPPPSPPSSPYHSQSNPPAIQDDSGSSTWEIEFCKSVRVPWKRILIAKNIMHCHDNVVKWDDCAAKEAFLSAKQRYWEKINRLPAETPLPDPNQYIDEVDWNSDIDPGLILELDRAYFNPDEVGKRRKSNQTEITCDFVQSHENPESGQNPWESSPTLEVGRPKEASTSWGHYTKSSNVDDSGNPWEQTFTEVDEASKNNVWRGNTNESWEGKQMQNNSSWSRKNTFNARNGGGQNMRRAGDTYRHDQQHPGNSWQSTSASRTGVCHEQQHPSNSWQSTYASGTGVCWDTERTSNVTSSWDRNRLGVHYNVQSSSDFREPCGGENALGCRKREGAFQHPPRHKSSRYQGYNYGMVQVQQWQKGNSCERVNFDFAGRGNK